jgi:aryl-alcohol dehydrogenase-like predicted oxidoreductase
VIRTESQLESIALGATDVRVPPIGIGTWQWGDTLLWGYGRGGYTDADLRAAFDASLANGIDFFDTAEGYGRGRSERLLGEFIRASGRPAIVATKFMPLPWRFGDSGRRWSRSLGGWGWRESICINPLAVPPRSTETWADALPTQPRPDWRARGRLEFGVIRCGARTGAGEARHLTRLERVGYSLLQRGPGKRAARRCRNSTSHSSPQPARQGLLTGKYSPDQRPTARAAGCGAGNWRAQSLVVLLQAIGGHGGRRRPVRSTG